jgi:hypothetical protein
MSGFFCVTVVAIHSLVVISGFRTIIIVSGFHAVVATRITGHIGVSGACVVHLVSAGISLRTRSIT